MPPQQVPPSGAVPPWAAAQQGGVAQPGGVQPGFGQPGYQQGRRKPARAEIPSGTLTAIWLMYAGAVVTGLYALLGFGPYARLARAGTNHPVSVAQHNAYDAAGIVLGFVIVAGFMGIAGWLLSAAGVRRGRRWGATLGTVLFGIHAVVTLFVLIGAEGAPVAKALTVVVLVIGLVTTICLWGRESRAFYRAFR